MNQNLLLYSCYTYLAYRINRIYYGDSHYVWCTPFFNPNSRFCSENNVPPTSSPFDIYNNLYSEIKSGDRHSAKVGQNRLGILRGAEIRKNQGSISEAVYQDIVAVLDAAELIDFRPLLFVIPFTLVQTQIHQAPIKDRANPFSQEFVINDLKREHFDIIELH